MARRTPVVCFLRENGELVTVQVLKNKMARERAPNALVVSCRGLYVYAMMYYGIQTIVPLLT